MDSIVNSINETVRKYCVDDSKTSPVRRMTAGTSSILSTSLSASVPSPVDSRLHCAISLSPHSSFTLGQSSVPPSSAGIGSQMNSSSAEVSFAMLAGRTVTPEPASYQPAIFSKPPSVDIGVQVSPADFHYDDVLANNGKTEIGIQAGGDDLPAAGDGSSFTGRCCPYCHSELPPISDKPSVRDAETCPPSFVVESPVTVGDAGVRQSFSPSESVARSSPVSTVAVPASLPSFVQCSLSLGDSFCYSPLRMSSSVATAPISIYPSNNVSDYSETGFQVPPLQVSACSLTMNASPADHGFCLADTQAGQNGSPVRSARFESVPNAESSIMNTPVVTFSITPEAARLPTSADSGGQLSNTSLSNITISELLPSMQGSIPLELLVNQADGFTMYTEIVPISEPCHVDQLSSINLPASGSSCGDAGVSEVAVSHESWSPTQPLLQQSPVNMMVCLPISSVSSPGLSSFLSQHRSLSSFAGDAGMPRPPTPETLAPIDTVKAVAIAVEDGVPKPVENYSIHRILETSALKQAGSAADCSWSSSNTGVLISRRDIAANSATLFDSSVVKEDNCAKPPNVECHENDTYHGNHNVFGNTSCHGDNSCHGDDDSDTHDDICVIDSDRDVIVIDGDDEVLRPNAMSDMAAAVPDRSSRVGRHGRRRRRQTTKSDTERLSRRPATSSLAVELDASDHSTSVNCLDNGFVEMSPSANVTTDVEQACHPGTNVQVTF